MATKIVPTFQAALADAKKNFIKAGINTVNIVAAIARKNAQSNIAKNSAEKNVTVSFSCTPAQKDELQAVVKASGMSQSEYILSKLFQQ